MRAATVIGVAGPVGAGKSALASALAVRLAGSRIVSFDAYEQMTERPVDDVRRWLASGAAADEVPVPGLERDLERLKAPRDAGPAARYVVFETQFGRLHSATGRLIDFLVWIDTPLDIALARKARQLCGGENAGSPAFLAWLTGYLDNYLGLVGELLRLQRARVMPLADLVLDGNEPIGSLADRVLNALADCQR